MITDAMVYAAWRAAPATVRHAIDAEEVRRMVAAAEAERKADAPAVPQRPDGDGEW